MGILDWDSHQSCIRLQTGAGFCTVLTADAVATGEVNLYNFYSSNPLTSTICGDDQPGVQ